MIFLSVEEVSFFFTKLLYSVLIGDLLDNRFSYFEKVYVKLVSNIPLEARQTSLDYLYSEYSHIHLSMLGIK